MPGSPCHLVASKKLRLALRFPRAKQAGRRLLRLSAPVSAVEHPAESTEPAEPTEPTEPTEPMEPMEPVPQEDIEERSREILVRKQD